MYAYTPVWINTSIDLLAEHWHLAFRLHSHVNYLPMLPCLPRTTALVAIFVFLLKWSGREAASDSVLDNPHEFKIFTFHRDEDELLGDWVKYHARIVGRSNIYILDNNSTSPTALSELEALRKVGMAMWKHHNPNLYCHAAMQQAAVSPRHHTRIYQ